MIVFKDLGQLGRLGNQLFQICATVNHARLMGVKYQCNKWEYNKYFLHGIDDELDTSFDMKFNGVDHDIYNHVPFHYSPLPQDNNNIILKGYFQSEKYFEESENVLREMFWPKHELGTLVPPNLLDQMDACLSEYCAVHVRRGDYLEKEDYHPVLSEDYYEKGTRYMRAKGFKRFMIFSDDIEWCKQTFSSVEDLDVVFSEENSDIQDLFLMARCGAQIIANSSFSWWGATFHKWYFQSKYTDHHVVAPKLWFGPKAEHDTKDIYNPNWITF